MRTSRLLAVLAVASLSGALLPAAHPAPEGAWALEQRVPASTLAFLSGDDVGLWSERLGATAIGRFLAEPEVEAFLAPLARWADPSTPGGALEGPLAQVPAIVWDLLKQLQGLHGQVAVAFLGMGERGEPQLAASLDFGPHASDFVTFLARLQAEVDPEGEHIRTSTRDGRRWWSMDADGLPVRAALADTTFVLATGDALLEQTLRGGGAGSLGTSAEFQAVRRKTGGDHPMLLLHANVAGLVSTFAGGMGSDGQRMMKGLGLDAVTSAAYGVAFAGDGFTETIVVNSTAPDRGLLGLLRMEPLANPRFLRHAPAGTFYFEESSLWLPRMVTHLKEMVTAVDDRAGRQIAEGLGELSAALGVDVEKEVLAGFAPGYAAYAAVPETGGLYPEVALLFALRDPAAFEGVMERLAKGIAGMVNEEGDVVAGTRVLDYRGRRLHVMDLQAARGDDPVPFTPTWAILGDTLVVTLVPHALKEIVLRAEATSASPGLAGQGDFRTAMAQKPASAGGMAYLNLAGAMGLVYDTGVPLLQTLVKPNMTKDLPFALDWAQLPAARTVRPYWRSMGMFASTTSEGLTLSMHGPVPILPLAVTVGAAVGVALAGGGSVSHRARPAFVVPDAATEDMDRQLAEVQVEDLYGKVQLYLLDKDALPKDLGQLVEEELLDRVPSDPWGRPFRLRVLPAGGKAYVIESAGPDGDFGTGDDVTSDTR